MTKKINMTFEQAMDYILNVANGKKCDDEMFRKMIGFVKSLPHHEKDLEINYRNGGYYRVHAILKDYDKKQSFHIYFGLEASSDDKDKLFFSELQMIDPDGFDRDGIASSNEEALAIMKEIKEIKFAEDIDEYWEMSDDPRVARWASEVNQNARADKQSLLNRL